MTKPAREKARGFAAPLGSLIGAVVEPTLAARGLGEISLIMDWPEIVGAEIARYARPIEYPSGRGAVGKRRPEERRRRDPRCCASTAPSRSRPSTRARSSSSASTRIWVWRRVEKIAFRQGPLAEAGKKRCAAPAPSASAQAQALALAAPIEDEELRLALAKLGARAIDRAGRTR